DRSDAVAELIKGRNLRFLRRTQLQDAEPGRLSRVLLLDTIGELSNVFQYATVVFVGGTLVSTGGHNVLEPAGHSKPIVFGPHMENFRDIARLFLEAKAAVQIADAAQLGPAVVQILANSQHASELGCRALAVVRQNTGATERVLRVLEPLELRR